MASAASQSSYGPEWYQAGLKDLYDRTKNLANQGLPVYQGERVAGFSPWQQEGMNRQAANVQSGALDQAASTALTANTRLASGQMLQDITQTPGYAGMVDNIQRQVGRLLTESYLPQVDDSAVLNNQVGGSPYRIGQALAGGRAAEAVATSVNDLNFGLWNRLLGAQETAIGRTPETLNTAQLPGRYLAELGAQQQMLEQARLEAQREKFKETANAPYFGLEQLRASLGQGGGGTTTTSKAADPSWWNLLLGGGLLYKSVFDKPGGN